MPGTGDWSICRRLCMTFSLVFKGPGNHGPEFTTAFFSPLQHPINLMSSIEIASVERLRSALTETLPYCSGTLALQQREFILYYGREIARKVDLSNATTDQMDHLAAECQPATFGRNDEDVLDETYRKAGKMDVEDFMLGFDVERAGLIDVVRTCLFPGEEETKPVKAELYKLNVYGQGAFFKAHKDTPRAENMFGSLVIVFPTPHRGGALLLRQEPREWSFDSADILSDPAAAANVAFVAFFNDVEHEVTPVLSGHRVTITYNLYFAEPLEVRMHRDSLPAGLRIIQPASVVTSALSPAIDAVLSDPAVLPDGGTIGFGLRHQYSLPKSWTTSDPNPLVYLRRWLKGSDAALFEALQRHGLQPLLRIIYEEEIDGSPTPLLFDHPFMMESIGFGHECDDSSLEYLHRNHDGVVMFYETLGRELTSAEKSLNYARNEGNIAEDPDSITVHMVTQLSCANTFKSARVIYYGNSCDSIGLLYYHICLICHIGPIGKRADVAIAIDGRTHKDSDAGGDSDSDSADIEDDGFCSRHYAKQYPSW
ncbi:hypothetical protein C8Q74DRAFT_23812 [Fomes fomentarius]|nr:hypothetical protein C8Q74DRAFT_23812 [Fomes fomentarius]